MTLQLSDWNIFENLPYMSTKVFENPVYDYLLALLTFVMVWMLLYALRRYLLAKLQKVTDAEAAGHEVGPIPLRDLRNFVHRLLENINPFTFLTLALWIGTRRLTLSPLLGRTLDYIVLVALTFMVIKLLTDIVMLVINRSRILNARNDAAARSTAKNLSIICKVIIWFAGILFLLDNFGLNVSTFLAGLGVGGVAIALASQAILGDTFSSFVITLDKPFEVEDFIIVGDMMGTVEHIGLKTTRVRSLSGELLVFSNSDLTGARIKNFKKMFERRINFQLRVVYETSLHHLKEIPDLIKAAIEATANTRFDRAHFFQYGEFSLIFDVVYFVTKPEYNLYMDAQQEINFRIHEAFSARGITFALPSQTVLLAEGKEPGPSDHG